MKNMLVMLLRTLGLACMVQICFLGQWACTTQVAAPTATTESLIPGGEAMFSKATVSVGGTIDRALKVTLSNGHEIVFDTKRMRLCRWLDATGEIQLSYPTAWGNPIWIADEDGKAINADGYHGKAKWIGYGPKGAGIAMTWQMPLRDGSFALVEETYSPITRNIYGTQFAGLKRDIWIDVPEQHRVKTVGIDEAFGIGGTSEGHTTYNLNHGTSMEILPWTKSKPVSTRRAEWGYSPRQKLGAMAQPFVFIDHPRGNIIIYPERLDYSWSANLQNHQAEGQDGIWPSFEAVVGEKSRRFHLGSINYIFSPDQTRRAPQRWIDAISFISNHYCDMYGLENRRFFVHTRHLAIYQITRATWPQNYDGRTLAEQQAPWVRKMGCDAVFVDIWKYFWPEGDRDNERYVGYSVDDLEISDDFGGDKGMKEFCDIMHRNGIAVILWANFQYLAGGKMSQTDGGRGSYLLRQHPEWRLIDKEGNTRGKGLTNMSFATGWKDYLIARLKHLYEECGIDGLWVDNSAGAVGLIDYGVEPPAGMMEDYWDIVRQIQDIGMTLLFEETGGATINGSPGYVWRKSMSMDGLEWGLTKGSITGVHTQTNAQRGLLHQNAAGAQTLRRLTDADAQQAKYMRAFMRKHGGLPDRISLTNLRYVRASKRWEYDNTDWVYEGVKSVPYRAVNTYQAEILELESGAIAGDTEEATTEQDGGESQFQSVANGKTHRIAFTAKAPVKDNPDAVFMLKINLPAKHTTGVRQTLQLYNYTDWKWEEVYSRDVGSGEEAFLWSKHDTGGHYVSEHGELQMRIVAESDVPFTCRVGPITVTVDEGTGIRSPIMSRRGWTRYNRPPVLIGGEPTPLAPLTQAAAKPPETPPEGKVSQPAPQNQETTEALIAQLTSPLQDRALAVFRLGEKGDTKAVPLLIRALEDEHWRVRDRAAQALYKLNDPTAVAALSKALGDPMWRVRFWAAKSLGSLKAAEAVPALIKAIDDEHGAVTEWAGIALARIKDKRGLAALAKALKSENVEVRNSAAGALGRWGGDEAVPALAKAIKDKDRGVRLRAADSLAMIGRPSCKDALLVALGGVSDRVRRKAIPVIAKLGDKRAVPLLQKLLVGGFHQTRAAARTALKQLGSDAVDYVLKVAETPITEQMQKDLKKRYGSVAKYQAHIALALGETLDKRVLPALQELAKDKAEEVSQVAKRAQRDIKRSQEP